MGEDSIRLTDQQESAIEMALSAKASILTGGPGTGKTTTCKELLHKLDKQNKRVVLCAPSGKAAKRMSEATGRQASTIHKALQAMVDGSGHFTFARNASMPLECDFVIVDETSMVSNNLMADLLVAIPPHAQILMVGDQDQLPSVGPGAVLRDILESRTIPHVELSKIHRNAGDIVKGCHAIKYGKEFAPSKTLDPESGQNLRHIEVSNPGKVSEVIEDLVSKKLPQRGYDPIWDIQVISPVNTRTEMSCRSLNDRLQTALNKNKPIDGCQFRIADKVIQTKNEQINGDYVVNGDMAQVRNIRADMTVNFFDPDRWIKVPKVKNNLLLAYAITCHRYQGSEAPVVVIPVHRSFGFFVNRSWIYTAISRAQQICITVGQKSAIDAAIKRVDTKARQTRLQEKLKKAFADLEVPF